MGQLALQADVAAKYDLQGINPGTYDFTGFGKIDLCELGVDQADALVSRGFPYLVLKQVKATPKAKAQTDNAAAPVTAEETPAADPIENKDTTLQA